MPSLKMKGGTEVSVEIGSVDVVAGCAVLYECFERATDATKHLVIAYKLLDGEIVRRVGKEEYIVEF